MKLPEISKITLFTHQKNINQIKKLKLSIPILVLSLASLVILSLFAISAQGALPYVAFETESAQSTQNASVVSDSSASGGSYLEWAIQPPVEEPNPEDTWFGYVKPGPTNTGPSNPDNLRPVGSMTIDTDGTVLENVYVTGRISIEASNVIIRNFRINATGTSYGIKVFSGENILFEDGEVFGMKSSGVAGINYTARRLNVHESGGDAFKAYRNVLLESNWMHHLGSADGAHADGVQNSGTGGNIIMRGNNCDMPVNEKGGPGAPYKSNACGIFQTNVGPLDNVLVEYNWLNGGNYTLYFRDKENGYGAPTNIRVLNNRFGRSYRHGLFSTDGYIEKSGNVWDDTGDTIN